MKKRSIRTHLAPYSIFQKRRTTINHAFASALAPSEPYDEQRLDEALHLLGQEPDDELCCIYCGQAAQTWDHLYNLVQDGVLFGFGHQIGNLVPCCRDCNSRKGSRSWESFLEEAIPDSNQRRLVAERIDSYHSRFACKVNPQALMNEMPEEWHRYEALKQQIFQLMQEADTLARKMRTQLVNASQC
jgi:hypothetical protein